MIQTENTIIHVYSVSDIIVSVDSPEIQTARAILTHVQYSVSDIIVSEYSPVMQTSQTIIAQVKFQYIYCQKIHI